MKYKKCYCVKIMLSKDLKTMAHLVASHFAAYAGDETFKGRKLFGQLQLPPAEEAVKSNFMAVKGLVHRLIEQHCMEEYEVKAKWSPQWQVLVNDRLVAGVNTSGTAYIGKNLATITGVDHGALKEELATIMG